MAASGCLKSMHCVVAHTVPAMMESGLAQKHQGLKVTYHSLFFPPSPPKEGEELLDNISVRPTPAQGAFVDEMRAEGLELSDAVRRILQFGVEASAELEPYAVLLLHEATQRKVSIIRTVVQLALEQLEVRYPGLQKQLGLKKK
jgi:hypothetical protein